MYVPCLLGSVKCFRIVLIVSETVPVCLYGCWYNTRTVHRSSRQLSSYLGTTRYLLIATFCHARRYRPSVFLIRIIPSLDLDLDSTNWLDLIADSVNLDQKHCRRTIEIKFMHALNY
jgi:hypothetical protein